jgi:hypothetical protein
MATIEMFNGNRRTSGGQYNGYKTNASMKRVIDYITNPEKTRLDLIKGHNCSPQNAYHEFKLNKELWDKGENGRRRLIIHFSQNFSPDDDITPEMASEIADKLVQHELFKGFQVVYATHLDSGKIHTHFVVDTVNQEDGHMWHFSKSDLETLKAYSDELCREYKLSVCQRQEYTKPHIRKNEIVVKNAGMSWKEEIRIAAMLSKNSAISREDFICKMKDMGISVNWTEQRKYITFTDTQGHKVRNHRLEPVEEFTKAALEKQFLLNKQFEQMQQTDQKESMEALSGIQNFIYIAKNLVQAAEQSYPLQNSHEFKDYGTTKASRDSYIAEQQKGRGLER